MKTKIHLLNASGGFNVVFNTLERECKKTLAKVSQYLPLPAVDIAISPSSTEYKTKSGVLGCVTTPYLIDIMVDTERSDLLNIIKEELPAVLAHELYHVIRTSSGVKEKTLLQILVTEGLACHFEAMICNNATPSFLAEIQKQDWFGLYERMTPYLNDKEFDYTLYFGGSREKSTFPSHTGYWVGFNLVSKYIKKYGGDSVALITFPAKRIVAR